MEDKIKIFVITHKKYPMPQNEIYIPLQVGAAINDGLGYEKDNVKDNISSKNPYYCELTGLYWIWKNVKSEYVGLTHYRRYFFLNMYETKLEKILSKEQILKDMQKYDVIMPKKEFIFKYNVKEQYSYAHYQSDLDVCRKIISNIYPEYLKSFDTVMQRKYFYPYNMFIMSKKNLDKYAKWLFTILFQAEKEIDITNYSNYNKRIYGFLAERLFNVWLLQNNLKIKEYYVNQLETNPLKVNISNNIKKILIRGDKK